MLIGIDVVENERFARAMERRPRLIDRLFTGAEQRYCQSKADPARHFAARFAAKEAVGKALGTGVLCWQEIDIGAGGAGQPDVSLKGRTRAAAERLGASRLAVSISHSRTVSVSVAVAGSDN